MNSRSSLAAGEVLPAEVVRYKAAQALAGFGVFVVGVIALTVWNPIPWITGVLLWGALPVAVLATLVDLLWINRLHVSRYSFTLDDIQLRITHGVFVRSDTSISSVQIVSVDVRRGPLLTALGLATVRLATIGEAVTLGPLRAERAAEVAAALLATTEARAR